MVTPWGTWKPFPDPRSGQHLDAPIGPGVFEVRHTGTGEQIAFGHSKSVAQSLAILMPKPASGFLAMFAPQGHQPSHRRARIPHLHGRFGERGQDGGRAPERAAQRSGDARLRPGLTD